MSLRGGLLLLVATAAALDSDFDWFRTFARDGLPALNKSLREELRRSEQLSLRESLLRAEADLHRAAAADAASAHPPLAAAAQNRERARRQLQRAGRPHEEVADELRDLHERRALVDSARLQLRVAQSSFGATRPAPPEAGGASQPRPPLVSVGARTPLGLTWDALQQQTEWLT